MKQLFRTLSFLKIRMLNIRIFNQFYQLDLVGVFYTILTRDKLSTIIDYGINIILYGIEYVKSKHLTIGYYHKWLKNKENYKLTKINININELAYKPIISIIMNLVNNNHEWLEPAIESIRQQFYPYWELCLYVNASNDAETSICWEKWRSTGDPRIKIIRGKEEFSPARACNSALKQADGEFIVLMTIADMLAPDALYEVARLINALPESEFIYSDEDKIQEDGIRFDPFFKPDWSPDLCLSMMYTGNLAVYRRTTVEALGGFREGFGAATAYDLVLRVMEKIGPKQIFHIPRILYHARSSPEAWHQPPQAQAGHEFALMALNDYRHRNGIQGSAMAGILPGTYRLQRACPENLKVSIIIPFRDMIHLLERCITSLLTKTDYEQYDIILVNNQSQEPETYAYLETISHNPRIRVLSYDRPFNFSAINNFAVNRTDADFIAFLNSDTEVVSPEWLSAMMEHMTRKEVGAVGAKLIYYDRTIQHAGVTMGITGICGHVYRGFPANHPGYFGQLQVVRNCSALTGACLLTKKAIFQAVGGFDQDHLPIAFNDVDLCLKILEKGYLIVWTPYALLYHHEYASRGDDRNLHGCSPDKYRRVISELEFIENKWAHYIANDPYYNPNLTRLFSNSGF